MAAQDDSAYQDNPYGMTDPSALFQKLTQENAPTIGGGGGINQGLMTAGFNPAMQKQQAIQSRMQSILGTVQPKDGEDPLDYQMRQARAVSSGMVSLDPQTAIRADQQMIRLENAKANMSALQSETGLRQAQTSELKMKTAEAAADPMVWVASGKDSLNLPTYNIVGSGVRMFDDEGKPITGWSNDLQAELQKNGGMKPGMMAMKQSQYLNLIEKTNEGKNLAQMAAIQQRTQIMMGSLMSPDAIAAHANNVVNGLQPPLPPPVNTRNPAAIQNYNNEVAYLKANGIDPGNIDANIVKENLRTMNNFNIGAQQGDAVKFFNVAVQHAQLLSEYFHAQKLYDNGKGDRSQLPIINAISSKWQDITGQPIPLTTSAMGDFVADEWTKSIMGTSRTALGDRIQAQGKLSRNLSDAQFDSVMNAWVGLGTSQLGGLKQEFYSGLKKADGTSWDKDKLDAMWNGGPNTYGKVAPETRAAMEKAGTANAAITKPAVPDTTRLNQARAAIKLGADPDAVKKQLGPALAGQL